MIHWNTRIFCALFSSPFLKERKIVTLSDLQPDEDYQQRPTARGIAGRPMPETPALEGARRAHIECDVNVDSSSYWNDPTGERDQNFVSPFHIKVRIGDPVHEYILLHRSELSHNVCVNSSLGWRREVFVLFS